MRARELAPLAPLARQNPRAARLIDQSDSSLHAGGVGCDGGAADVAPPYGDASNVQLQQAIRLSKLEEDRRQKQQALRAWSAEEARWCIRHTHTHQQT